MHMWEDMNMMEGLHEHRHAWSHIFKETNSQQNKTEAETVASLALSPGGETKKRDNKGKTCTCQVRQVPLEFAESLQFEFSAPLCQHA